jgi:hypothetical protein
LEAFANVYGDAIEAIRRHIDGNPLTRGECRFPTVHDGVRGMQFIYAAVESSRRGGVWVTLR